MPGELSSSAQKVQDALKARGLICSVVELPSSTRSAQEAAQAIGCAVEQIVKSLVFRGKHTRRPILVLAGGANRVNEQTIGALVREPIEKADANFVKERTGFAIGGVPPLAHTEPIMTFIDEDLLRHQEVWAAAGTPHAVFKLNSDDLGRVTGGQVVSIK
jgi:prolyl-tRNA editing enzyme YbaK/EbsC (Cys-tRNA(Pro) deacylase)